MLALTAAPAVCDGLACACAPQKRRRPVGLAKLVELRIPVSMIVYQGKGNGALRRKRDRASGLMARPVWRLAA